MQEVKLHSIEAVNDLILRCEGVSLTNPLKHALTRQVHLVRAHFVDRTDFGANRRLNPLLRQTCESHP
jgi:hypothetical protein